jgi:hypothetical protein
MDYLLFQKEVSILKHVDVQSLIAQHIIHVLGDIKCPEIVVNLLPLLSHVVIAAYLAHMVHIAIECGPCFKYRDTVGQCKTVLNEVRLPNL